MTCFKLSVGNWLLPHHHLTGDKGLAVALNGGAGGSLWERGTVWMTLTVRVSRAPAVQSNPDCSDEADCTRLSTHTHKEENTTKPGHKRAAGDGLSRAQLPPVLSQLLMTWVTQLQAGPRHTDRGQRWGKVARWKGGGGVVGGRGDCEKRLFNEPLSLYLLNLKWTQRH